MNKVYVALCNCCPLCCVSVWSALLVNVTLPKIDSVCYNSPLQCLHSVLDVFMENELIILNLPWKKTNKQKKKRSCWEESDSKSLLCNYGLQRYRFVAHNLKITCQKQSEIQRVIRSKYIEQIQDLIWLI